MQHLLEANSVWLVEPIVVLLVLFDDASLRQRLPAVTSVQLLLLQAQVSE
jgi:hypothetical protein